MVADLLVCLLPSWWFCDQLHVLLQVPPMHLQNQGPQVPDAAGCLQDLMQQVQLLLVAATGCHHDLAQRMWM